MNRSLLLLRHAEAAMPAPGADDFDRGLTPRGLDDAHKVALQLVALHCRPQTLLSSTALRTRQTAQVFAETLMIPSSSMNWKDALYAGGSFELENCLLDIEDAVTSVLLVAHNPSISTFCSHLTGSQQHLRPSSVVWITGEADSWAEFAGRGGGLHQRIDAVDLRP
jgi:phosphohistidine phosphatase